MLVNRYDPRHGYGKLACHRYSMKASVMIVGQNPSHDRYRGNHALSGRQGDYFRKVFGKENLIMTNLVPYSTVDNKITIDDALHGLVHLLEQIRFYRPKLIIGLGTWVKEMMTPLCQMTKQLQLKDKVVFMTHPDHYYIYNPMGIPEYHRHIDAIHKTYLQKQTTSI